MAWQAKSGCAEHRDDSGQVDSTIGVSKVGCSLKTKTWKATEHHLEFRALEFLSPGDKIDVLDPLTRYHDHGNNKLLVRNTPCQPVDIHGQNS